jgi:hypothetical protein
MAEVDTGAVVSDAMPMLNLLNDGSVLQALIFNLFIRRNNFLTLFLIFYHAGRMEEVL